MKDSPNRGSVGGDNEDAGVGAKVEVCGNKMDGMAKGKARERKSREGEGEEGDIVVHQYHSLSSYIT
jgi:hypothetical protein